MIRPPRSAVIRIVALAKFVESTVAMRQLATKRTCRMNFPPRGRGRQFHGKPVEFMATFAFFRHVRQKSKFHWRNLAARLSRLSLIPKIREPEDIPGCRQNEDRPADPARAAEARRGRPSGRTRRAAWPARVRSRPCSRPLWQIP